MIDAKEAESRSKQAFEGDLTPEMSMQTVIANTLRGIMGELYRLRKLKELEAKIGERQPDYIGTYVDFDKLYMEGEGDNDHE